MIADAMTWPDVAYKLVTALPVIVLIYFLFRRG